MLYLAADAAHPMPWLLACTWAEFCGIVAMRYTRLLMHTPESRVRRKDSPDAPWMTLS